MQKDFHSEFSTGWTARGLKILDAPEAALFSYIRSAMDRSLHRWLASRYSGKNFAHYANPTLE